MSERPTHEELEQRVKKLEREAIRLKRVGAELKKSPSVVDAMTDGVVITGLQGKIIYVNRAVTEQLGYKRKN